MLEVDGRLAARNFTRTMQQRLEFLRESLRNLRATGSVAPSSRFLCRRIVAKIDPAQARVVVELGPGDGVITHYILERLPADARLIVFEINGAFVEKIRTRFDDKRLTVIHDSAEHMGRHFEAMGVEKVDYFISGIPFVMLPETLSKRIIAVCRRWLKKSGQFVQFHYSPLLVSFYRRSFGNVRVEFIPLNLPPALIVSCFNDPSF